MIAGIILGILAVLLLVVGALGWKRKLPGNKFIGIRVPEVRKNKDTWDAAHQVAGPVWMVAGFSMLVAAMMAFAASNIGWLWILCVLGVVGALVLVSLGANFGAQTAYVLDRHAQDQDAAASGCCSAGGNSDNNADTSLDNVAMPEAGSMCGTDGGCGTCTNDCAAKLRADAPNTPQATAPSAAQGASEKKVDLDAVRRAAQANNN